MPTLKCVILPPLKLAFKLSQMCHNSPITSPNSTCKTQPKNPKFNPKSWPQNLGFFSNKTRKFAIFVLTKFSINFVDVLGI